MSHLNRSLLPLLLFSLALVALSACAPPTPDLVVEDMWARQSPMAEGNGAAYLIIKNNGGEADALIDAAADISDVIELHETTMENEVMRMRPVAGQRIEIPAKGEVELKPGGLHIMFIGLNQQLTPGDSFDLTLEFEKAGKKSVSVEVRAMEGMSN